MKTLATLLRFPAFAALLVLAACGNSDGGNDRPAPTVSTGPDPDQTDLRVYMHGIETAKGADGRYLIFFSSSRIPPTGPDQQGNWTHDVYLSTWASSDARISLARIFIQKPEAQEPVSVAQTTDGHIMVSFEDGWNTPNGVNQRYGVYEPTLQPIAPYPLDIASGGHSGHVAAVGHKFVAFYSEDWIAGDGVDNLGTGNGVYAKVYDSRGQALSDRYRIEPARMVAHDCGIAQSRFTGVATIRAGASLRQLKNSDSRSSNRHSDGAASSAIQSSVLHI